MTKKDQAKKDQIERFKEKAKELGADETGAEFELIFKKITPPKSGSPNKPKRRRG